MLAREIPRYETGLQQVGDGIYACMATPTCSGTAAGASERRASPSATPLRDLVHTHTHIDHVGGNRELETSETAAHANCRAEMEAADPPARRERRPWLPDEWWAELTVEPALPTRTFDDDLTLD